MSQTIHEALRELVVDHRNNKQANLDFAEDYLKNDFREQAQGHKTAAAVRDLVVRQLEKVLKDHPEPVVPSKNLPVWFAKGATYRVNHPGQPNLPFEDEREFFKNDRSERYAEWSRGWQRADDVLTIADQDPVIADALVKSAWDKVRESKK